MNKTNKLSLLTMLMMVFVLTILSGCGSSTTKPDTGATEKTTQPAVSVETGATSATASTGGTETKLTAGNISASAKAISTFGEANTAFSKEITKCTDTDCTSKVFFGLKDAADQTNAKFGIIGMNVTGECKTAIVAIQSDLKGPVADQIDGLETAVNNPKLSSPKGAGIAYQKAITDMTDHYRKMISVCS